MGRKAAGGILAAAIVFVIFIAAFRSAETEDLAQPKEIVRSKTSLAADTTEETEEPEPDTAGQAAVSAQIKAETPFVPNEKDDYEDLVPTGNLLMEEDFSDSSDTFGFTGAAVKDGALRLTEHMLGLGISVKNFDHVIMGQSFIEAAFDWRSDLAGTNGRSGLEFRDLYGRLIFAVSGGYNADMQRPELKYSSTGAASNASKITVEPHWTTIPYESGKTYRIFFRADFVSKKADALIKNEKDEVVGAMRDADISASGLAKMTAACYAAGTFEEISDFKLYGPDDAGVFPLAGKKVIAFGDSIVDGHLYKEAGFVEFLAAAEGMDLEYNYANNGARIMPGSTVNAADGLGGTILDCQVNVAAAENRNPDYIIFDGGANDAYANILQVLGTAGERDSSTFAGAFRNTVLAMHKYWPKAKIVYVAVHKLGARDLKIQEELRALELAICRELGVEVADLYTRGWDSTDAAMNQKYAFDDFDAGQIPIAGDHTTGAHPNFLAIEELYVPVVSDALKRAKDILITENDDVEADIFDPEPDAEDISIEEAITDRKPVESITFPFTSYQVAAGKKITLKPKAAPSDAADKRIDFQLVSNKKFASLEFVENGCEVTVKKSGAGKTVSILAKALDGRGAEKEIKIQIMKNAVTKVSIDNSRQTLVPGKKAIFKASVKTNGKKANKRLIWASSDKKLLTVKQNKSGSQCVVTAKAAGAGKTVTVTAQATDGTGEYAKAVLKIE